MHASSRPSLHSSDDVVDPALCPPVTGALDPLAAADRFIIDLDGTLIRGGRAVEGAAELLALLNGRFVIVSNNSRELAGRMAARLARLGLDVPAQSLVLAGEETIRFIAMRHPGARCLIAASGALRRLARSLGLVPVQENPEIVILGRDTGFRYDKLVLIANALRAGAQLVAANPDLTHPDLDGRVVPETGALLAAVASAANATAQHIIGKPEPLLFEIALARLGAKPQDTIVIGDNPLTDAIGAERAGLRAILVDADGAGKPHLRDLLASWRD